MSVLAHHYHTASKQQMEYFYCVSVCLFVFCFILTGIVIMN